MNLIDRSAAAQRWSVAMLWLLLVAPVATATPGQPGTLDASWATLSAQGAGKLRTSFGNSNDVSQAVVLQPDGKGAYDQVIAAVARHSSRRWRMD